MKTLLLVSAVFVLSVSAETIAAEPRDDTTVMQVGRDHGMVQEARVVRRGVVVGPRGGMRTFTYRGRPLAALRRPAFIYPPGFAYRRWAVGALLPAALIAAPFLFLEYQALGLQPPPPGQVWVRHGPDVILIDERTRKVNEVAYGAIQEE